MVLKRADSSTSQWAIPPEPASLDHDEIKQQRRLRHLSAVLVRNLTVEPRRGHSPTSASPFLGDAPFDAVGPSSSLRASAPESSSGPTRPAFASDDLDLLVRNRRRRATSNASLRSKTGPSRSLLRDTLVEAAEEGVGVGSSLSPSKPERTSLRRSMTGDRRIRIQEESDELFEASVFDGDSATAQPSTSHHPDEEQLEADDEVDVDDVGHTDYFSPSSPSESKRRNRSSSRTSIASAGTTGSGSTIRPRSELDSPVNAHAPARTFSHSASNTRLPDTLASRTASRGRTAFFSDLQLAKEKRRRIELLHRRMIDSTITLSLFRPREQTEDPVDPASTRRPNTLSSPRPHRPRRSGSTASIPGRSASRGMALPSAVESASPLDVLPPFFIAPPACKTLNPTFMVEPSDFLVDPETQDLDDWPGLQEEHVLVSLWTKRSDVGTDMDKGKAKEQNADSAKADWTVLVEWDVSLDGLVSLGRDPTQFPHLQPNTIIFALADEYFTAPLPLRTRFRPFASDDNHSSSCSEDDSDGAGNYSDPGAGGVSHSWRSRRRRRREEEEAEEARRMRKVLVERSLRETRMVKVADVEALLRFKRIEHERCETKRTLHEQKQRLGAIFGDADGEVALSRESEELQDQVDDLVAVRDDLRLVIDEIGSELEQRKDELRQRRIRLESARSMHEARAVGLDQQRASLGQSEGACAKIRRAIAARRAQLITLLTHMFPIEPVATDGSSLLFSILSIPLPNSTYPPNSSDDQLSSALGYAAQVVSALAAYIGVPLHYPIKCLGSRSAVIDPISMMRGPRAFPLYGKGVDKYRFDYGVFLLNKDIEQLMYSQGLTVIDLRNTLPNLKALVLALSFASSQAQVHARAIVGGIGELTEGCVWYRSEFASLSLHPPARFPNLSASSTDPEQDLTNELEEASLSRPTVAPEEPHATLTNGDEETVPALSDGSESASERGDSDPDADSRSVDTMRTATASKPQSTPTSSSKTKPTEPITAQEKQTTRTLEPTPTCIASNGAITTAGSNGKVKTTVKAKEGSSATKALRNSLWTAVGYGSPA